VATLVTGGGRTQFFGRPATVRAGLVSDTEMGRPSTRDREVGMTEKFLFPASEDVCFHR
jgi:hypothetical protein